MLDVHLDPESDEWKEYIMPKLCEERTELICADIAKNGHKTKHQYFYDVIYELVQEEIEEERREGDCV